MASSAAKVKIFIEYPPNNKKKVYMLPTNTTYKELLNCASREMEADDICLKLKSDASKKWQPNDVLNLKKLDTFCATKITSKCQISVEYGGENIVMDVKPDVDLPTLHELIKKKLGVDGKMDLKHYDKDIEDWVEGDLDESLSETKFLVTKKVSPHPAPSVQQKPAPSNPAPSVQQPAPPNPAPQQPSPQRSQVLAPSVSSRCCCLSMQKHIEFVKRRNIYNKVVKNVASWLPSYRKWERDTFKKGEPLAVYFMNSIPSHWKCGDNDLYRNYIMEVARGDLYWKNCFTTEMDINEAHIRVKFHEGQQSSGGSWSALGSMATLYDKQEPTMFLDLSNMTPQEIDATIIHQFGHALGLGHTLMKKSDWDKVKEHVNINEIERFMNLSGSQELVMQMITGDGDAGPCNYDENSVMTYSIERSWLKVSLDTIHVMSNDALKDFSKHLTLFNADLSRDDKLAYRVAKGEIEETAEEIPQEMPHQPAGPQYLGKTRPDWNDIDFLRHPSSREKFQLSKKIGSIWNTIGLRLSIEPNLLDCMMDEERSNARCLARVFKEWFDNAGGMKNSDIYPLSWQGLRNLLEDCDKEQIAAEYFAFLSKF